MKNENPESERMKVRLALERSTGGVRTDVQSLVDAVPAMMRESRRRRDSVRRLDALTASIPYARTAIPRLAAVAALLLAITTVLLLSSNGGETSTTTASADEWMFSGSGYTEDQLFNSLIDPEATQ